jgi:hypothetical protein
VLENEERDSKADVAVFQDARRDGSFVEGAEMRKCSLLSSRK